MNSLLEHKHRKSQEMQANQGFRQAFIVSCQPSKTSGPDETAFNNPAFWQQHEAFLGFWQFDHNQFDAMLSRILSRSVTSVPLVNKGDLNRIAGGFLNLLGQFSHLISLLFIGWGDVQSQQMAQGINGHMHFAAFFTLMTIVAGPLTTFRTRFQGPTIENRRRGLSFAACGQSQQYTQIMDHSFKYSRRQPPLRLLIDGIPGRQIVGHHPPRGTGSHQPTQAIKDFSQLVLSLGRIFAYQNQIGRGKGPFIIIYIAE